jgi:hypothetical protein
MTKKFVGNLTGNNAHSEASETPKQRVKRIEPVNQEL